MQQHSIFEPLYSLPAPMAAETGQAQPAAFPAQPSLLASPSWFSCIPTNAPPPSPYSYSINRETSTFSSDHSFLSCKTDLSQLYNATPSTMHASMISTINSPAASTSFTKKTARSEQNLASDLTQLSLPILCPAGPPTSSNHDCEGDDGSVASKLLSSITKSISSPSLQLASCKESIRETPYQKTLRLKQMKLQHCAEALGMESSDTPSSYESQYIHHEKHEMKDNPSLSFTLPNSNQDRSITSVKSAPNLSSPHLTATHSRYMRCTSFPPPLSHTLPVSPSCDSLSLSLRPYRQDGRLILKEVMVPSKNYFHSDRRDGRLTLRVFTRESDEDHEDDARHYDQKDVDYQSKELTELREVETFEDIVSLQYKQTLVEGPGNRELDSINNIIQTLDKEEYDEKKSVGINVEVGCMEDHFKEVETTTTAQSLGEEDSEKKSVSNIEVGMDNFNEFTIVTTKELNVENLQCIADSSCDDDNGEYAHGDGDENNVISNVITLSLKACDHSKVTVHKAQVLSSPILSSYPPLYSSSFKQSTLRHPGGLLSSHHDTNTYSPSKENFIWESNLMPCVAASQLQRGGRHGGGITNSPAFVMEEISTESLMKVVSELASSLILEASYTGGNWCLSGKRKIPSASGGNMEGRSTIIGAYSAMNGAIMDGGIIHGHEGIFNHWGVDTILGYDEEKARNTYTIEGGNEIATSPLHFGLQIPSSSTSTLNCDEWLQPLHCKELFDGHQLGRSFMKLHCIATRS